MMMNSDTGKEQGSNTNEEQQARPGSGLEPPAVSSRSTPGVLVRLGLAMGPVQISNSSWTSEEQPGTALADPDWSMRVAAVEAVGNRGEQAPLEPLLHALHDESGFVRAAAARALGKMIERAPVDHLVEALQDSEWRVRTAAALALGALKERAPVEPLIAVLKEQEEDVSVRVAAASALGKCLGYASKEALADALHDPAWQVREMAALALADRRE